MSSSTVGPLNGSSGSWKLRPTAPRKGAKSASPRQLRPISSSSPDSCGSRPSAAISSVVLPAPMPPRMTTRSPSCTSRSTPLSTTASAMPASCQASVRQSTGTVSQTPRTNRLTAARRLPRPRNGRSVHAVSTSALTVESISQTGIWAAPSRAMRPSAIPGSNMIMKGARRILYENHHDFHTSGFALTRYSSTTCRTPSPRARRSKPALMSPSLSVSDSSRSTGSFPCWYHST